MIKNILICLFVLYIANFSLKWLVCTYHAFLGKRLKKQLHKYYDNRDKLYQLYPSIKMYCADVKIRAISDPYGTPDELINKANFQVIRHMNDSLNEAIGVYLSRRRYCYILFTVQQDNKSGTFLKIFIDTVIKIAASVIIEFLKIMSLQ